MNNILKCSVKQNYFKVLMCFHHDKQHGFIRSPSELSNSYNKLCKFFAVPGNSLALLGIQDIDILDVLTIYCITTDTNSKWTSL